MKEFKIYGCICVPENIDEDEFWNQFIDLIESNNWLFGGGINKYTDDTMRVVIEVEDKKLDDMIIQCFRKRNIKHDKDLVFVSSGYKDDFSNMFICMFQLINNDDIYPYLNKVLFIDNNGDIEDVLSQSLKIRKKDLCDCGNIVDIPLNEKEMELAEKYAQKHSLTLEEAFKQSLFEEIKDR